MIFLNHSNVPKLNENQISLLENDVIESEVLSALKSMKNGKSPGLDGLPIEVYKVLWNDIKLPFMKSLKFSYACGYLSLTQKQGIMCLLHKNDTDREVISNWRPLSLTNADYKLIAKIFARRINLVIDTLIDANQYAFVKGRTISTMLREIDDIFERERNIKEGSIILSIDYAKAFDSLSLSTIKKALNIYGFGDSFKKWIEVILSNRLNCVRNGGYVSSFFDMERGVRQGCPISPLLFIMAVELFACNIRTDKSIRGLQYNTNDRPLKIRLYADDITLFLKDMMDFREVLSKIKKFSNFSGLCLNINKTLAVRFGDENWVGVFKCGIRFVDQIKILGIYFSINVDTQSLLKNFSSKIENLEHICHLWSRRKLTLLGKITILKAFGLSQFIHIMQSIGIPDVILSEINKIMFRFLWKSNFSNSRTCEKVNRATMCNRKDKGGLDMIDLKKMQMAFYLNWAEQFLVPKHADWKILPFETLRNVGGTLAFQSNVTANDFKGLDLVKSSFWKKVLITWLDNNLHETLSLKTDDIIFNNKLIKYKNNVIFSEKSILCGMITLNDFMPSGEIITFNKFKSQYGCGADALLVYNTIFNALNSISKTVDFIHEESSSSTLKFCNRIVGTIGRKSILNLITKDHTPIAENTWLRKFNKFDNDTWMLAFSATTETKLQILQWKILQNIYPTAIFLKKIGIKETDKCSFCNSLETLEHFFSGMYPNKTYMVIRKTINSQ